MAFVDYYKVMGIPKDTPQSEIKAAYKKRVKQFHTDLNQDDPKAKAKTQMLNEAKEVLMDPKKRALYDRYGERWRDYEKMQGGPYSNSAGQGPFWGGDQGMDFDISDILGGIFGGGRKQRSTRKAEPTFTEVHAPIDVWTAMLGGELIATTPYGKFKLKIPAGTQPGKKVKIAGKGGTTSTGVAKDLIIVYDVKIPETLTERQRELLQQAKMS